MRSLPHLLALAVALVAAPAAASAQESRPVVAVLPFENGGSYGGDQEDFDALRRGLAGTLMSELAAIGGVRLASREKMQELVEGRAAPNDKIDLATAAQLGKSIGARYAIVATFIDVYGDFRIDAQIIDVEAGQVVKVVRSDPKLADRGQMYRIIQSVAERALQAIRVTGGPRPAGPSARNIPTEALALYSRGLLYQDRGDRQRAIDFFSRAVRTFPGYSEAEESLRRLRGS
jgi:TolB-like protein